MGPAIVIVLKGSATLDSGDERAICGLGAVSGRLTKEHE